MRLIRQRPFLMLLLAILVLVVLSPVLNETTDSRLVFAGLFTLVFLPAFLLVFARRRQRWVAIGLAIPVLLGVWTDYALPDLPRTALAIGFHSLAALYFSLILGAILLDVYKQPTVS